MAHYQTKCKELISQAENDSFCRAQAHLMLSSGSPYLEELKFEFLDQMKSNELLLELNPQDYEQKMEEQRLRDLGNSQVF